ncbi:S41 family peptidase [Paenibacillus segetis]|uniref:Tail specific protease domain-containing protein n=1 Tax=Paenibacillus segetis TaxID=1325360 RepID=A0ABQ1Y9F9_9BACL|nr:S41 family peptidase [Paenibacillus segetis]GGH16531.1 hypothetical protein GCM10008013_11350 [Paenibacillus segetis]
MKKMWIWLLTGLLIITALTGFTSAKDNSKIEKNLKANTVLSDDNIDDLFVLGKIWGYLKYYHPNVAKGDRNWDDELFLILPKVLEAKSPKKRDMILSDWIDSLGAYATDSNKPVEPYEIKVKPDLDWITKLNLEDKLETKLLNLKIAKRTGENQYISINEGAGNPIFTEEAFSDMNYPGVGYRLLSVYRYWNIIEYYFPHKNLIEEDWDNVLKEFIPKFVKASNEQEYKLTTLEIIARIHDSHAGLWEKNPTINRYWGENYSPLVVSFVEDKLVVTSYYNEVLGKDTGLKIGDVITKINKKPVSKIVKEKLKYIPASNFSTQLRDISGKLLRTNDSHLTIDFERDGKAKESKLKMYSPSQLDVAAYDPFNPFNKQDYYSQIDPEISYIYLGNLMNENIPEISKKISNSKGLIIDLRCYPKEFTVHSLSALLLPQSTDFTAISMANTLEPGQFLMVTLPTGKSNPEYFKGKVVILVNELTQSLAEFTTMALKTAPDATVIGSTTAGADGDMSIIKLPGGLTTAISGTGIYYPDGSETQRIGIIPDITVKPTIQGIKENRDEVLQKAIDLIHESSQGK